MPSAPYKTGITHTTQSIVGDPTHPSHGSSGSIHQPIGTFDGD